MLWRLSRGDDRWRVRELSVWRRWNPLIVRGTEYVRMKLILIGAVLAGGLIAIVLLVFQPGGNDGLVDQVVATVEDSAGVMPDHPGGLDSSGAFFDVDPFAGITLTQPDPVALREQLISLGVEVPDGAGTEELMELMAEYVGDGFIGFAP